MRQTVGNTLMCDALATLSATSAGDAIRRKNFFLLTRPRQIEALRKLAEAGMSDAGIGRTVGLSSDMICRLLSESSRGLTESSVNP